MSNADALRANGLRLEKAHVAICGSLSTCGTPAGYLHLQDTCRHLTSAGPSLSGKSTCLLNLLRHIEMFNYQVDRVVVFYYHNSPLYDQIAAVLDEQDIKFDKRRYEEMVLDMEHLNELREPGEENVICCFDDVTSLIDTQKSFNHLIHVARHSGLVFILLVHGLVFTKAESRSMVSLIIKVEIIHQIMIGECYTLCNFYCICAHQAISCQICSNACKQGYS